MLKKLFSFLFTTVLLILSCSGNQPEIKQSFLQLNVYNNPEANTFSERLSFYVHAEDEDGIEDIEFLYLINDEEELFWKLSADNWERKDNNGEIWIGSNKIVNPLDNVIPRGAYRIILIDTAGERVELEEYISSQNLNFNALDYPYVEYNATTNDLTLESRHKRNIIWLYSANNELIQEVTVDKSKYNLKTLLRNSFTNTLEFYIYSLDREFGVGLVTGPFSVK